MGYEVEEENEKKLRQAFEEERARNAAGATQGGINHGTALNQPRGGHYYLVRYIDNVAHEWGPFTAEAALQTVLMRGSQYSIICRHGRETPVA
jgi:hypothetical protein